MSGLSLSDIQNLADRAFAAVEAEDHIQSSVEDKSSDISKEDILDILKDVELEKEELLSELKGIYESLNEKDQALMIAAGTGGLPP